MNLRPLLVALATGLVCLAGAYEARAAEASCLLRIQFDSDELPLGYPAIDALVRSSGVVGSAAREIDAIVAASNEHQVPISEMVVLASFEETPQRGQPADDVLLGRLTVYVEEAYVDGAQEHARTILASVCTRLQNILEETSAADHERLRQRLAQAEEELAQAMQQRAGLRALGHALCREAGLLKLERVAIIDEAQSWTRRQRELEMEMVARNARQHALASRISDLAGQIGGTAEDNPVIKELQELVNLRERNMAYYKERPDAMFSDTLGAEERLIEARVQLAQMRQEMAQAHIGDMLGRLNQELSETLVELAEVKVQLQETSRIAERYGNPELLALAERFEDEVETPLHQSESRVRDAFHWQQELERALMTFQPPTITILGGLESE